MMNSLSAVNIAKKYNWFENRLKCMSLGEIVHRFAQLGGRLIEQTGLLTASEVPSPKLINHSHLWLFCSPQVNIEPYIRAAETILLGRLDIFSLEQCAIGFPPQWNKDPKTATLAPLRFGKSLDYRNEQLVGDIKYLWEPSRHLHLVTLAQAYALTDERKYLDGLKVQLESWFDQCPYLKGPQWTSSLELGIRLINWSLVWQLIGGVNSPLFVGESGQLFLRRWLKFIYQHCHFIKGHFSRYSSANNHLIGEAAGLFIATITWPYWSEFGKFNASALKILEQEVLRQNAPDGVNLEQAISYQQFVLDFMLLSKLSAQANGISLSSAFDKRIECMLEFVASVIDVAGNIPMIGDADDGYVVKLDQEVKFCPFKSLLATGSVLFQRPEFKAAGGKFDDKNLWLLGINAKVQFDSLATDDVVLPVKSAFPNGGYYILGNDFNTSDEIKLIVDAGPLGYQSIAAHGHADALSFTLSVSGNEILIDPGTYSYHSMQKWRNYFRSTAAHNTVCVDHTDQSEIGGNFMWLDKATSRCLVFEQGDDFNHFVGQHDGYLRLDDPVLHRREILLKKDIKQITVTDLLECNDSHDIAVCWHFSEHCKVSIEHKTVFIHVGGIVLSMSMTDKNILPSLLIANDDPPGGWVSRRFDCKVPTTTVVWKTKITTTAELTTKIDLVPIV